MTSAVDTANQFDLTIKTQPVSEFRGKNKIAVLERNEDGSHTARVVSSPKVNEVGLTWEDATGEGNMYDKMKNKLDRKGPSKLNYARDVGGAYEEAFGKNNSKPFNMEEQNENVEDIDDNTKRLGNYYPEIVEVIEGTSSSSAPLAFPEGKTTDYERYEDMIVDKPNVTELTFGSGVRGSFKPTSFLPGAVNQCVEIVNAERYLKSKEKVPSTKAEGGMYLDELEIIDSVCTTQQIDKIVRELPN
tara:strand:+ start:103 stop:837 length:735 start_codon:yes stop_codon:yes gene_type:complete